MHMSVSRIPMLGRCKGVVEGRWFGLRRTIVEGGRERPTSISARIAANHGASTDHWAGTCPERAVEMQLDSNLLGHDDTTAQMNTVRLLTIWARLNSETWVSRAGKSEGGGYSRRGPWTVPKGLWVDSRTVRVELTPFGRHLTDDDHKEDACNNEEGRKNESFWYTYPELQDLDLIANDDTFTEKQDLESMHLEDNKEREELERRVWAMYGRGVEGLFIMAGVEEEGVVSAREASGNEENLAEVAVPLPRPLLTPSSIPTRVKEKSTRERVTRPSISTRLGGTSARPAAKREKTQVWVWDWKARVRIREFEAEGGESVEVRVFLVAARELYEEQELVLSPSRSNTKPRDVSPTSMLPQTGSFSTLPNTASSNNVSSSSVTSTATTYAYQPRIASTPSEAWDYDHPGYVGCVGTFVNELDTAELCGNCMARRRLGPESDTSYVEEGQEEGDREGSVVQGTVYLSERIVEQLITEHNESPEMWRDRMKGLRREVVLPFLRERLRWGV
ncbi:hypothetical protein BC629DRAFT_1445772 [Irpex lacteus]|nr:hypothetical protein BC629DRAFT_1445772 [Irpex lacteus]